MSSPIQFPVHDVKPLYWVRPRSDGGFDGPIADDALEDVRKNSGAWFPLFMSRGMPTKMHEPPGQADVLDTVYTSGWNACCDAFFGGLPAPEPLVVTVTHGERPQDGANKPHPDDEVVDRFAAAMKAKLAKKRAEGRFGWEDRESCREEYLSRMLRQCVDKGDPVDVANFAMMLHERGEKIGIWRAGRENWAVYLAHELEGGCFAPNVLQNEHALRTEAAAELRRLHAMLLASEMGL